jgi:Peptidase family M23
MRQQGPTPFILTAALPAFLFFVAINALHAGGIETVSCKLADGFDHAVGKPDAKHYHKDRGFWPNGHLGEDWNGDGGGDTDYGDPIYSIGHGVVVLAENVHAGWGNVMIVRHAFRDASGKIDMIDSLYGHLKEMKKKVGDRVERGELIATMGNNFGMYSAHLHLEIRKNLSIGMNRTRFAQDYSNYYSPTAFIESHRHLPAEFRKYPIPVNTFAKHGEDLNQEQINFAKTRPVSSSSAAGTASSKSNASGSSASSGTTPTKTASGLSIPITTSGSGKSIPKVSDKPATPTKPTTTSSDQPPSTGDDKGDFWSRLKSKLKNGQSVDSSRPPGR